MNGCIVPRNTVRSLAIGVAVVLTGVTGTSSHAAFAWDYGVDRPASVEPPQPISSAASLGDGLSVSLAVPDPATPGIVVAQNAAADPAIARLEVRLSELERDLRASTGRVEDLSHQVRQLKDRLEKLSSDVDYRLGQTGGVAAGSSVAAAPGQPVPPASQATTSPRPLSPYPAPVAGPVAGEGPTVLGRLPESEVAAAAPRPSAPETAPPAEETAQTTAASSAKTPREQYAYGFGLLRKANYDEAEVAFTEFLSNNPHDPLADNARYWLGETYYARGDYALAAEAFLDAYQRNKTGPKAPDSLLKLGMSLGNLEKIPEACATYDQLRTALPDAPVSIKTKAQKERRVLGCK